MRTAAATLIWVGVTAASLGIHVAAFGGLGNGPADGLAGRKRRPASLVEMQVDKPKAAPPPPQPQPPKAAPRLAVARPLHAAAPKPAAPPPPSAAPPPAAETPADFTGTTLTNDGAGPGWASATGNGAAMNGPVGRPGARVTGRASDGPAPTAPRKRPDPVVSVEDLSRRPEAPPDLASVLERFYPPEARSKGVAGKAVLRARVTPDGELRELALLSETAAGFGAACRQTLQGSRWTPPLDRGGKPVSTVINYTCRFEVQ